MTGDHERGAVCVICGVTARDLFALALPWDHGHPALSVCLGCEGRLRAANEAYGAVPASDCLNALACEVEQAATGHPDPAWRRRVLGMLGRRFAVGFFRAICGCRSCVALRDAPSASGGLAPWPDLPAPADRAPLDLAAIDPAVWLAFIRTLNPGLPVLLPDGRIVPASRAASELQAIFRDDTARPAVGPLARAAQPRGPIQRHDVQAVRRDRHPGADWSDLRGKPCPCGCGDGVQLHPENCLLCDRPAPYAPDCSGVDRPLVVLCVECQRDLAAATASPDGWRYIVQPGHGLESLIGRTRLAQVNLPDGAPVFDLATVAPGYRPLVLAILPADLLAVDRHGEVAPVAEWVERIFEARRRAAARRGGGHV